jgi:hypothetical protein
MLQSRPISFELIWFQTSSSQGIIKAGAKGIMTVPRVIVSQTKHAQTKNEGSRSLDTENQGTEKK